MKKTISIVILSLLSIIFGVSVNAATYLDFCPGQTFGGWWGNIYPSDRLCASSKYTWNTTSIGGEESYYKTTAHYIMCNYSSFENPGDITAKMYIPAPDSRQTSSAHYYRWSTNNNYLGIASVNQYNSYKWVYSLTTPWNSYDMFKLSDWTSNEAQYTKHVDIDKIGIWCQNL